MAEIFISHSSRDNDQAKSIRDWLLSEGWGSGQIFLDLDELRVGDRWRERLNEIGGTCQAVIVCLSDHWIRSPECVREFTHAESRGKPILPVQVAAIRERVPRFVSDLQIFNAAAELGPGSLSKLGDGLLKARISPRHFPWPPPGDLARSPYRGLRSLEAKDAAAFFGRDLDIARGLDALRLMHHEGESERILVVLGASGAGKSSFLRAGLLPRLARDKHGFSLLPVLRPEGAALTGEKGLLASLGLASDSRPTAADLHERVAHLCAVAGRGSDSQVVRTADLKAPLLVLPIDQAEEFFSAENTEGAAALRLTCELLEANQRIIAVATIRSDSYDRLQAELQRSEVRPRLFDLPLMPLSTLKDVIEGPGKLLKPGLEFQDALVSRLIQDFEAAVALPLLAFALERLVVARTSDRISLAEYTVRMGGLGGIISDAVEAALDSVTREAAAGGNAKDFEALARRTFIPWLVQVDPGSRAAMRRRARIGDFPEDCQKLVSCLVDQRLLSIDVETVDGKKEKLVQVTHEAVLRHWPLFSAWLEEESSNLVLLDNLRLAASDWVRNGRASDWLVHSGRRLDAARALLANLLYSNSLPTEVAAYLAACGEAQRSLGSNLRPRPPTGSGAASSSASRLGDDHWRILLERIEEGRVVPVVGNGTLVEEDGERSIQLRIASALLQEHGKGRMADGLTPFSELHEALGILSELAKEHRSFMLHRRIQRAMQAWSADTFGIPAPLMQLAKITDFHLYVTLTADQLLARAIRQGRSAETTVQAPRQSASQLNDLPPDWRSSGAARILHLLGSSENLYSLAVADSEVEQSLDHIASGGLAAERFLAEVRSRDLLFIGCYLPDWLVRRMARVLSRHEVRFGGATSGIGAFLLSASLGPPSDLVFQIASTPTDFVSELHTRWTDDRNRRESRPVFQLPLGALFFVSYAGIDLARAMKVYEELRELGVGEAEIWLDRAKPVQPDEDLRKRTVDGIRRCRYFLPLISRDGIGQPADYAFTEWDLAAREINPLGTAMFPLVVDEDFEPGSYDQPSVAAWVGRGVKFAHAPEGVLSPDVRAAFTNLIRDARRRL